MRIQELAKEHALLESCAEVLSWDEETYLPANALAHRADQVAWLHSRAHELVTSAEWEDALNEALENDSNKNSRDVQNLRLLERELRRAKCLPIELINRESVACSKGKHAWAKAREKSHFPDFLPHLEVLLDIAREKAELWGYSGEAYDALLENYERNTSTAQIVACFAALEPAVIEISTAAIQHGKMRTTLLPAGPYPVAAQMELNARVAAAVGFDFDSGRIDTTAHPFCTTLGPRDIRITTRYDENDFTSSLFGVLHEAGHGLYEQGLPVDDFGLPSGKAVSLGIHESQSRLWENHVGRSRAFWHVWYPKAQEIFPQLKSFPLEDFMHYLWRAEHSQIRVEADEATYDLHIFLRVDLERRLLAGNLTARDLPEAWNAGYTARFGFAPEDDRHGCLQDIHWAMGGIGYFATYTLGNMHAAQLFAAAMKDASIANEFATGNFSPLLDWLRNAVHRHGGLIDPWDLITSATGVAPNSSPYIHHLRNRYLGS
ncbi:MAG: carboxypeptidase M32 [Verrucomicrobia bacterium]|nr:MAG: carboxypeptidase M32 [Verrucomicrobiota bacterium]